MSAALSFCPPAAYRGHRDYYHSTDLYMAMVGIIRKLGIVPTGFDLKLRERIVMCPRFEVYEGVVPADAVDAPALARLTDVGGRTWHIAVRMGAEPITARKPYDEDRIWLQTRRERDAFVADGCKNAEPIELVTAVGVLAHRTLYPPVPGQRWMLAQLKLNRLLGPDELSWFHFEVSRRLSRGVTQGVMSDRTGPFGQMVFILK